MKAMLIAAGLIAAGAGAASAQYGGYNKEVHPYAQRHHATCQEKAIRLHGYEHRAAADGKITHRERETIRALERDLDRTCGRYRHHG